MSEFKLAEGLYLHPSPTGAYFATSEPDANASRTFLQNLLLETKSPALTPAEILRLSAKETEKDALELLYHTQKLGWIAGIKEPLSAPQQSLESLLPEILPFFSSQQKALLADEQGFYLGRQGFSHESAEELSALSAEIAIIHQRRAGLLKNNLGIQSQSLGIIDAQGNNQLGFWPLYIGDYRFILVIAGTPFFNHPAFTQLIWTLMMRYTTNRTE